MVWTVGAMIALAPIATQAQSDACKPSFTGLGFLTPDAFGPSIPYAVSADGRTVVGQSNSPDGFQAFRWTEASGMVGLGSFPNPGGFRSSIARAVSGNGGVIAGASVRPDSLNEDGSPFLWSAATGMVYLGNLGGSSTGGVANGITADGKTIVGYSSSDATFGLQAFRFSTTTHAMTALGDLAGGPVNSQATAIAPDGARVVGLASESGTYDRGFSFTDAGGLVSFGEFKPLGVSAGGTVVVGLLGGRAERVSLAGFESLPHVEIPGLFTDTDQAWDVNVDGSVVVGIENLSLINEFFGRAFVWDPIEGTRIVQDLLGDLGVDLSGWELNNTTSVSADGRVIAGYGFAPSGEQEAWVAQLPPRSDFDHDLAITTGDVDAFLAAFRKDVSEGTLGADFDGDHKTDRRDVFLFLRDMQSAIAGGC